MDEVLDPTPAQILACPMEPNDADASTIGEYLVALLVRVWSEREGFSGKRPFGNSGWTHDLAIALVRARYAEGYLDGHGYVDSYDEPRVYRLIAMAIAALYPQEVPDAAR